MSFSAQLPGYNTRSSGHSTGQKGGVVVRSHGGWETAGEDMEDIEHRMNRPSNYQRRGAESPILKHPQGHLSHAAVHVLPETLHI